MESVYLETTIPSYLTARPAKDQIVAGKQAITREWWDTRREEFDLFVSELVQLEASRGDRKAVERRQAVLNEISLLPEMDSVEWIAGELLRLDLVPQRATPDAFHIAYSSACKLDYLLTWNCRHIANAQRLPAIKQFCPNAVFGFRTYVRPTN